MRPCKQQINSKSNTYGSEVPSTYKVSSHIAYLLSYSLF